jgi:hypothetical protein
VISPTALTRCDHRNRAGTPVGAGVPANRNLIRALMYTEEVPVTTSIAPRLVAATILTIPAVQHVAPAAAAKPTAGAVGLMFLVVVVMAGILLAVVASAARSLVAALAELARLAAVMMSAVILTAIAILTVVALMAHH